MRRGLESGLRVDLVASLGEGGRVDVGLLRPTRVAGVARAGAGDSLIPVALDLEDDLDPFFSLY